MRGALVASFMLAATPALAQSFALTADEAKQRINKQIKDDNGDGLNRCRAVQQDLTCKPDDRSFQRSVKSFRALSGTGGKFELQEEVSFAPAKGRLESIALVGDRGSPMGLLHFIGQVGSVIRALDPEVGDDRFQDAVRTLGLMRGDDDPPNGAPRQDSTGLLTISCRSPGASTTSRIECRISPRS